MPDLFLEIRSQELAARHIAPWVRRLTGALFEELTSRGFAMAEIKTGATPRRVALTILGLPAKEPDREEIHLGPPIDQSYNDDGEPTEALLGFCARLGVTPEALDEHRNERGVYASWLQVHDGAPLQDALAEMIPRHLTEAARTSPSRFGSELWPRPITGLAALLDGSPLAIELDGNEASATTVGHPSTGDDGPEPIDGWESWSEIMASHGIVPSLERRRRSLAEDLEARAQDLGGEPVAPTADLPAYLDTLAAGTAIPTWIQGQAQESDGDEALRDPLPEPLWLAALGRARALGIRTVDGLLPIFFTVVDRPTPIPEPVCRGFERAVAGHLADARFAFEADQRVPLARRVRYLEQLTFHPSLGTWAEKGRRLKSLVESLCSELDRDDLREAALEASTLLKADLATAVVREFPHLRGTIGGAYARREGYIDAVWQAIEEQYLPSGPEAPIPRSVVGRITAVADRLGTLVGFLGLHSRLPDRKHDPHGLRPLATGLLRILIEGELSVDLDLLAARAVRLYGNHLDDGTEAILKRLQTFLDGRLDQLLGRHGFHVDEIAAVKAVGTRDLPDLYRRLRALRRARGAEGFRDLVLAAKRIANMIADFPETELDRTLLAEEAEIELHRALNDARADIDAVDLDGEARYEKILGRLVDLAPPLDRFFSDVLVMDEDERRRANRMALLQTCRRLYWKVARLNAMEAETWAESDSSTTT